MPAARRRRAPPPPPPVTAVRAAAAVVAAVVAVGCGLAAEAAGCSEPGPGSGGGAQNGPLLQLAVLLDDSATSKDQRLPPFGSDPATLKDWQCFIDPELWLGASKVSKRAPRWENSRLIDLNVLFITII